jgi:hypothetical protein
MVQYRGLKSSYFARLAWWVSLIGFFSVVRVPRLTYWLVLPHTLNLYVAYRYSTYVASSRLIILFLIPSL